MRHILTQELENEHLVTCEKEGGRLRRIDTSMHTMVSKRRKVVVPQFRVKILKKALYYFKAFGYMSIYFKKFQKAWSVLKVYKVYEMCITFQIVHLHL